MRIVLLFVTLVLSLALAPCAAFAADAVPPPQGELALPAVQVYALLIGSLVPLVSYVLNHYAPWCSEPIKALVQVVVAAVAGGLYQALDTGELGLNTRTLTVVGTSVISALFAHRLLWAPSGISARLGGGSNAPRRR